MNKILIVGAGLSGSVIAEQFANKGYIVDIIDKRDHIGGNCFDYINDIGILMNKYGAHIFHTNSEKVWTYIQKFSEWIEWKHKVIGSINNVLFPIPVNIDTVNILTNNNLTTEEDMNKWLSKNTHNIINPINSKEVAISRVGDFLYNSIFKDYTYKQWEKYPEELDPSVLARIPIYTNNNTNYFNDKYQVLPKYGYTKFISNMLNHPNITIKLNTEFDHSMKCNYKYIFYTGPIDLYFASINYPKLEYRSIKFIHENLDIDKFQCNSVINYPSLNESFTRIVEYKHFLNQNIPNKTTIVKEYTCSNDEPYYPVPTQKNKDLYEMYKKLAIEEEKNGIYFVGRLANYKYFNMDQTIENALNISNIHI